MAEQKPKYDIGFKQATLRLQEISDKSGCQINEELVVKPGLLNKWKKRYQLQSTTGEVKPGDQHDLEAKTDGCGGGWPWCKRSVTC